MTESTAVAPEEMGKLPVRDKKRGAKHDWPTIRTAYIEGVQNPDGKGVSYLTLRQIAERFNVHPVKVRQTSSKERWPARRKAHQMEAAIAGRKERLAFMAEQATDFDDKSLSVAKMGMAMVTARLAEIAEELKHSKTRRENARIKMERGEPVERHELWSAINYKELEGLSKASQTFQEVGRKAIGNDVDKVEITGLDGGAIQIDHSIREELSRDDPDRLAQILMAAHRAGVTQALADSEVVEAEIVEDEQKALGQ